MAKPNLIGKAKLASSTFSLGRADLVMSADIGCMVYGAMVAIPKTIEESTIRLVPKPDSERFSDKSPDFDIEILAEGQNGREWQKGAGIAFWREKDGQPRLDCGFNFGYQRETVWAAFFPADDEHQPQAGAEPKGYSVEHGPITWRLAYTPPRKQSGQGSQPRSSKPSGDVTF